MLTQKKLLSCVVLSAGLLAPALPSLSADSHSKDAALIRAAIKQMDIASDKMDADAYVVSTAPDFVSINIDGVEKTHGKAERHDKLAALMSHLSGVSVTTTISSMTFVPGGAMVTESQDYSFTDAQGRTTNHHGTFRDFWVKNDGAWLEKRTRTVSN